MKKLFSSPSSKLDLQMKFENRVWTNRESFSEYLYDKVILSNKAKIDESELVDQLIECIPDESWRDQAKMQRFKKKGELLKAFEKIKLNKKTTVANEFKNTLKTQQEAKTIISLKTILKTKLGMRILRNRAIRRKSSVIIVVRTVTWCKPVGKKEDQKDLVSFVPRRITSSKIVPKMKRSQAIPKSRILRKSRSQNSTRKFHYVLKVTVNKLK